MSPDAPERVSTSVRETLPAESPTLDRGRHGANLVSPFLPRVCLWIEFAVLFVGLPLLLYTHRHELAGWFIPILGGLAVGCTVFLWLDGSFERRQLWNRSDFRQHLTRTLRWFLPGALLVGATFAFLRPDLLLTFPRFHPEVWLGILVTYPVLSVYPQEVVFRTFFFHRYHALFPTRWGKIAASGLTFGFAHIIFANWLAPVMTAIIGFQFAITYARTGSTLQVSVEHGIWGVYAFTVGLGWFVYSGAL